MKKRHEKNMKKKTGVSPSGRNRDTKKSRLVRDWGEMEKKGREWEGIRGKGRKWMGGESRNVDYVQKINILELIKASLSVSGNQVNNQESNQVSNRLTG